jgi:ankyrin repeat protein
MQKKTIELTIKDKNFIVPQKYLKELFLELSIDNYKVRKKSLVEISDYLASIDNLSFMIFRRDLALEILKSPKLSGKELFELFFDIVLTNDEIKKLDVSTHEHLNLSLNIPEILNDLKQQKKYKNFINIFIKAKKQYSKDPQFLLLTYYLSEELNKLCISKYSLSYLFTKKQIKQDNFLLTLKKLGYNYNKVLSISSNNSGHEFLLISKKLLEYGIYSEEALRNSILRSDIELLDLLLTNSKANPNLTIGTENLLGISIDKGEFIISKILLDAKADVNLCNKYGDTALLKACKDSNLLIANLLLKYQANPNKVNKSYNTPLLAAIDRDNHDLINLLAEYNANWNEVRYLFQKHKQELRRKFIKTLIKNNISQDDYLKIINKNSAHIDKEYVTQAEHEYQIIVQDKDFIDSLTGIVTPDQQKHNHKDQSNSANQLMVSAIINNNTDDLDKSLKLGANPNFNNPHGLNNTHIIHLIAWEENLVMLKLLIQYNIDLNLGDTNGNTPLYLAAYKKHLKTFACLIENGADLYITNHAGISAYDFINDHNLDDFKKFITL